MRQRFRLMRQAITGLTSSGKPGGTLSNEATQLQYPLRPGLTWVLRDDPRFIYTVEALEHVDLPIGREMGYRIRVDVGTQPNPDHSVYVWFGRLGMLGFRFHEQGPDYSADQTQWLTAASVQ